MSVGQSCRGNVLRRNYGRNAGHVDVIVLGVTDVHVHI